MIKKLSKRIKRARHYKQLRIDDTGLINTTHIETGFLNNSPAAVSTTGQVIKPRVAWGVRRINGSIDSNWEDTGLPEPSQDDFEGFVCPVAKLNKRFEGSNIFVDWRNFENIVIIAQEIATGIFSLEYSLGIIRPNRGNVGEFYVLSEGNDPNDNNNIELDDGEPFYDGSYFVKMDPFYGTFTDDYEQQELQQIKLEILRTVREAYEDKYSLDGKFSSLGWTDQYKDVTNRIMYIKELVFDTEESEYILTGLGTLNNFYLPLAGFNTWLDVFPKDYIKIIDVQVYKKEIPGLEGLQDWVSVTFEKLYNVEQDRVGVIPPILGDTSVPSLEELRKRDKILKEKENE